MSLLAKKTPEFPLGVLALVGEERRLRRRKPHNMVEQLGDIQERLVALLAANGRSTNITLSEELRQAYELFLTRAQLLMSLDFSFVDVAAEADQRGAEAADGVLAWRCHEVWPHLTEVARILDAVTEDNGGNGSNANERMWGSVRMSAIASAQVEALEGELRRVRAKEPSAVANAAAAAVRKRSEGLRVQEYYQWEKRLHVAVKVHLAAAAELEAVLQRFCGSTAPNPHVQQAMQVLNLHVFTAMLARLHTVMDPASAEVADMCPIFSIQPFAIKESKSGVTVEASTLPSVRFNDRLERVLKWEVGPRLGCDLNILHNIAPASSNGAAGKKPSGAAAVTADVEEHHALLHMADHLLNGICEGLTMRWKAMQQKTEVLCRAYEKFINDVLDTVEVKTAALRATETDFFSSCLHPNATQLSSEAALTQGGVSIHLRALRDFALVSLTRDIHRLQADARSKAQRETRNGNVDPEVVETVDPLAVNALFVDPSKANLDDTIATRLQHFQQRHCIPPAMRLTLGNGTIHATSSGSVLAAVERMIQQQRRQTIAETGRTGRDGVSSARTRNYTSGASGPPAGLQEQSLMGKSSFLGSARQATQQPQPPPSPGFKKMLAAASKARTSTSPSPPQQKTEPPPAAAVVTVSSPWRSAPLARAAAPAPPAPESILKTSPSTTATKTAAAAPSGTASSLHTLRRSSKTPQVHPPRATTTTTTTTTTDDRRTGTPPLSHEAIYFTAEPLGATTPEALKRHSPPPLELNPKEKDAPRDTTTSTPAATPATSKKSPAEAARDAEQMEEAALKAQLKGLMGTTASPTAPPVVDATTPAESGAGKSFTREHVEPAPSRPSTRPGLSPQPPSSARRPAAVGDDNDDATPASPLLSRYKFLCTEPSPGIYLDDLELEKDARFRAAINRLIVKQNSVGPNRMNNLITKEEITAQEATVNDVCRSIAETLRDATFEAKRRFPYLELRISGVLLGVVAEKLDGSDTFQSLLQVHSQVVRGAAGSADGNRHRLASVERCLCAEADKIVAATLAGRGLVRDEHIKASIAALQAQMDARERGRRTPKMNGAAETGRLSPIPSPPSTTAAAEKPNRPWRDNARPPLSGGEAGGGGGAAAAGSGGGRNPAELQSSRPSSGRWMSPRLSDAAVPSLAGNGSGSGGGSGNDLLHRRGHSPFLHPIDDSGTGTSNHTPNQMRLSERPSSGSSPMLPGAPAVTTHSATPSPPQSSILERDGKSIIRSQNASPLMQERSGGPQSGAWKAATFGNTTTTATGTAAAGGARKEQAVPLIRQLTPPGHSLPSLDNNNNSNSNSNSAAASYKKSVTSSLMPQRPTGMGSRKPYTSATATTTPDRSARDVPGAASSTPGLLPAARGAMRLPNGVITSSTARTYAASAVVTPNTVLPASGSQSFPTSRKKEEPPQTSALRATRAPRSKCEALLQQQEKLETSLGLTSKEAFLRSSVNSHSRGDRSCSTSYVSLSTPVPETDGLYPAAVTTPTTQAHSSFAPLSQSMSLRSRRLSAMFTAGNAESGATSPAAAASNNPFATNRRTSGVAVAAAMGSFNGTGTSGLIPAGVRAGMLPTLERPPLPGLDGASLDASNASLNSIYLKACEVLGMKPNSALIRAFPNTKGSFLDRLDLSVNYVGVKGLHPVLYVLEANGSALKHLSLSNNNLENMEVLQLLDVLSGPAGDELTHLDLSYNPISQTGGQALLRFAALRPVLATIKLKGTLIPPKLMQTVVDKVEDNAYRRHIGLA